MRRSKTVSAGARLLAAVLILPLFFPAPAVARMRIETGRDLYNACAALAEHTLSQQKPTPRSVHYCRQYLGGYFESIRHLHNEEVGKGIYAPSGQDPYVCLNLDGPRSYDQLARQIVRTGEWNPHLLDGAAINLANKAFSDRPPC